MQLKHIGINKISHKRKHMSTVKLRYSYMHNNCKKCQISHFILDNFDHTFLLIPLLKGSIL